MRLRFYFIKLFKKPYVCTAYCSFMKKFESPVIYALGTILIVGGIYTLYISTSILFDLFDERKRAGSYIQIAVVCNFICSFIYIVSGILFFNKKKASTTLLFIATIIMFVGYIGMLFHINENKPFELSVIPEMLIRTTCTMLYAAVAWYFFTRTRLVYPDGYDAKSFKKIMKDYQTKKKNYANPNYR